MRFTPAVVGIVLIGGLAAAQERTHRLDELRPGALALEQERRGVPELVEDLQSHRMLTVALAIRGLGELRATQAIPELVRVLWRRSELEWPSDVHVKCGDLPPIGPIGEEVGRALARIGPGGGAALARFFLTAEPDVRGSVLQALRSLAPGATDAVPGLKDSFPGATPEELIAFVEILGEVGPKARVVIPDLLEFLAQENVGLRTAAALALVRIERRPSLALLVPLFAGTGEPTFHEATKALLEAGEGAVPALADALEHESAEVRRRAALVLRGIALRPDLALAPLAAATRDEHSAVAQAARDALVGFGGAAVATIEAMLASGDTSIRHNAFAMLARIGPGAAEVLIRALDAEARDVRIEAARTLANAEELPAAAVPALARGLGRADPDWSLESLRALARLGPQARDALPAVEQLLDDKTPALRARACVAAARISGTTPAADRIGSVRNGRSKQDLIAATSDEDADIRAFALATFTRTATATPENLRALLAALADREPLVRREAVSALRSWAAGSAAAREALQLATADSDRIVRWRALEALR